MENVNLVWVVRGVKIHKRESFDSGVPCTHIRNIRSCREMIPSSVHKAPFSRSPRVCASEATFPFDCVLRVRTRSKKFTAGTRPIG